MKHVINSFILPQDASIFMKYYDAHTHLCYDNRKPHSHRNLHYHTIPSKKIKNLLDYYENKIIYFIDHYFQTKTEPFNEPRLVRWSKDESMPHHRDQRHSHGDNMDYSALSYLNDNYEGGELFFEDGDVFKMKALSTIIFPSPKPYGHGVKKIIKGKRYTIPSWYQIKKRVHYR
jgi:predicted 2-oxoglutarate/Fe(II)-dependent dioxygenase YbiX